jgi:hypothetical protein
VTILNGKKVSHYAAEHACSAFFKQPAEQKKKKEGVVLVDGTIL